MTVITSIGSSGRRRPCTARCYRGKPTTRCKCVCGGGNHARGLDGALENARQMLFEALLPRPDSVASAPRVLAAAAGAAPADCASGLATTHHQDRDVQQLPVDADAWYVLDPVYAIAGEWSES